MNSSPWWNMAATIIPPTAMAVWAFLQWFFNRRDKREERESTYEEKRDAAFERDRQIVAQNQLEYSNNLRADIEKYRGLLNDRNTDRFHAWDRARKWHQIAWELRNEVSQARQLAESAARQANLPAPVWTYPLELPPFDDQPKSPG